jgi:adenylosuccinate synthase
MINSPSVSVVLGVGYGDEGKGKVVDALSDGETLNIRFSGGHQCGHHVVLPDGRSHVFSSYGSGALKGATTYIDEKCTVYPISLMNEYNRLNEVFPELKIRLHVHPLAMITIPQDMLANQTNVNMLHHGTCGVGFGQTIQRNEDHFKLYAMDLYYDDLLQSKLNAVKKHYYPLVDAGEYEATWDDAIRFFRENVFLKQLPELWNQYPKKVFEGSQGVLLDMDHGVYPHVTRSNTTIKNVVDIFAGAHINLCAEINIFYVSRCYATRHGNGDFNYMPVSLVNNEQETNKSNPYQGDFKTGELNFKQIEYAISTNRLYIHGLKYTEHVVFNCFDHLNSSDGASFKARCKDFIEHIRPATCEILSSQYVSQ